MFKKILVPTDGSAISQSAVQRAVSFAKDAQAHITFFYGEPPVPTPYLGTGAISSQTLEKDVHKRNQLAAQEILNAAAHVAAQAGVTHNTVYSTGTHPHELIIQTAHAHHCDLIFMASHGRTGLKALLLGSVTANVLAHSKIPVLVYR